MEPKYWWRLALLAFGVMCACGVVYVMTLILSLVTEGKVLLGVFLAGVLLLVIAVNGLFVSAVVRQARRERDGNDKVSRSALKN